MKKNKNFNYIFLAGRLNMGTFGLIVVNSGETEHRDTHYYLECIFYKCHVYGYH